MKKIALLLALFSAYKLPAQVVGASVFGTVTDESGSPVPQANVTVKNAETGTQRKLLTDDSGRYAAPSISIGRYEILAEKQGFATQVKSGNWCLAKVNWRLM